MIETRKIVRKDERVFQLKMKVITLKKGRIKLTAIKFT